MTFDIREHTHAGGADRSKVRMTTPRPTFVDVDVREVFERNNVEEARGIHRKVNLEIERKKEELRMLVG